MRENFINKYEDTKKVYRNSHKTQIPILKKLKKISFTNNKE